MIVSETWLIFGEFFEFGYFLSHGDVLRLVENADVKIVACEKIVEVVSLGLAERNGGVWECKFGSVAHGDWGFAAESCDYAEQQEC